MSANVTGSRLPGAYGAVDEEIQGGDEHQHEVVDCAHCVQPFWLPMPRALLHAHASRLGHSHLQMGRECGSLHLHLHDPPKGVLF